MKYRVADLLGALLDAAVAKAGAPAQPEYVYGGSGRKGDKSTGRRWAAMTDRSAELLLHISRAGSEQKGKRAYVASKFGDEVELP